MKRHGILDLAREPLRIFRSISPLWQTQLLSFPSEFEKRGIIKGFLKHSQIRIFIETGTYKGGTTAAVLPYVDQVISIEIDETLGNNARKRFAEDSHVRILIGDSSELLPEVLNTLDQPALFWLDGHYSNGITGGNPKNAPIMQEIQTILQHSVKNHTILIDDARLFSGRNGYPSIRKLSNMVSQNEPNYRMNIFSDIIRIYNSEYSEPID